ncbi:MAG: HTH domain-containing protein [Halarcobacter sp.]
MSLCFLSLEMSKIFNKLILQKLEEEGFDGLSESLIILFPYILENKKITASQLAKKVGYSRQAMYKNIKKLEDYAYITLILENQKEKSIQLTPKSDKLILLTISYIEQIEENLAKRIGKKELDKYIKSQEEIYTYLDSLN